MQINSWEELKSILYKGQRFVYNDFGTYWKNDPRKNNKLHKASCPYLKMLTPGSADWTYYFDTMEDAIYWLETKRKDIGYCMCKGCLKNIATISKLEKIEYNKNKEITLKDFKDTDIEKIADLLIKIYLNEKLPWSVNYFKSRGFVLTPFISPVFKLVSKPSEGPPKTSPLIMLVIRLVFLYK